MIGNSAFMKTNAKILLLLERAEENVFGDVLLNEMKQEKMHQQVTANCMV